MILSDYHVHTLFCDGKNSPKEYVEKAIKMGLKNIGFSAHSYTFFDESYCLKKDDILNYKKEIDLLKSEYANEIRIYCGIEKDFYSTMNTDDFDYVIGSVHYLKIKDKYYSLDNSKESFIKIVNEQFNGDYIALCKAYFETISRIVEATKPNIIGHFDLVTKYNKDYCLFNEKDKQYVLSWQKAVDNLLKFNIPFEINTGAISRGYKKEQYPSDDIIKYIESKKGSFILSSDSHKIDTLCYKFDNYKYKGIKENLFKGNYQ